MFLWKTPSPHPGVVDPGWLWQVEQSIWFTLEPETNIAL
jgi:hypothetical protein